MGTNFMRTLCIANMMYAAVIFAYFISSASATDSSTDPDVNITETDPPSNGYRVYGEIATDVTLTCYVENLPTGLQVRWQRTMYDKDGRETFQDISWDMAVADNNKWSIEKPTPFSWRLRIKALEIHDDGNYTCYVELTGNNNRAEANRTVFAYATPLILESESSSNMEVKEGDYVQLRCNASGRPQPTIMWRRQGNAVLPGGGVRHLGGEYIIEEISYDARGLYICEGLNDAGYDRRDITLTIQHAPKILAESDEVGQAIGYQRTMICYIEANPAPSLDENDNQVYWQKGNERVQASDRWQTTLMEGAYGRITYELTIFRVRNEDYGVYSCHARTNLGAGDPADIELYETDEPQPDKRGEISSTAQLTFSLKTMFILFTCLCLL